MRILFFSDNFRPEVCPPAIHVYERARMWVNSGHQVTVVTCAPNFPDGKVFPGYKNHWRSVECVDGIRVVRVKTYVTRNERMIRRTLDYMSYVPSALLSALAEERPEVVISTSPQLFVPVAGLTYARLRGVPHVFELRDLWPESILATTSLKLKTAYHLLERLELSLYRGSTRVSAITPSFVDNLAARGIPRDKIDVVIGGTDLAMFSPRPKDAGILKEFGLAGRFVIGYIGTFGLAHGLENVIEAAQRLAHTSAVFFLVGSGAEREHLENVVRSRGLTNVVFAPRQSRDDIARFCSVCDASLVHLRDRAVFKTVIPSKMFEAMAMGKPVLYVGPEGDGAGIVTRHQAGLVVPPEDPAALAAAVERLLVDPQLVRRLGVNGHAASSNYSREQHAHGTLEVLKKAVESRREVAKASPRLSKVEE